ncbi:MAG: cytochrome c [Planctomycetes bacterium]|nr:cytochrome c [Planctomycetota bacterium]
MNTSRRSYLALWCVLSLAAVYLLMGAGIPWLLKIHYERTALVPTPSTLKQWYMALTVAAVLVYVTSSPKRIEDFFSFFRSERGEGLFAALRFSILAAVPLVVGWAVYGLVNPGTAAPVELRIQHPSSVPEQYRTLTNPFRDPTPEMLAAFRAAKGLDLEGEALRAAFEKDCIDEGRIHYQATCRVCHGTKTDGNGPFARGYRLRPVDFTIKDTITTIVEGVAFWRVKEGGSKHNGGGGLPNESSPWDSAMPAWKNDFTDEQIWKIIMAEYDIAHVRPRETEKHGHQ